MSKKIASGKKHNVHFQIDFRYLMVDTSIITHELTSFYQLFAKYTAYSLILVHINANIICEEAEDDEDFCTELREENNQNCYFNPDSDTCVTVSCGFIEDEDTCNSPPWSTEFECEWDVFEDTRLGQETNPPSGDLELCYTRCPLNLDVVFIVDTSQSVVTTNPNNAIIFGDFVETVMDTWWKINEQLGLRTAFGMVSFATEVETQFDLNREYVHISYTEL